jgi:hypothetical protein
MRKVLQMDQREQAGSDSYNRFEYQVHWIVCHIIQRLESKTQCIVFCEYHDDMSELPNRDSSDFEFYQIKTKEDPKDWTIAELSKRELKSDGSYKKTFLGFIFYNFMQFGEECSSCHFVSNNPYDKEILAWQACIEDEKDLKTENKTLYDKIKERLTDEYRTDMPSDFNEVFDRFIQSTYIYSSDLQLKTYENQTKGTFFEYLSDKKIPTDTANLIFQQVLNDVRKKCKEKIKAPISMKSLIQKKGIQLPEISNKISYKIGAGGNYDEFTSFLRDNQLPTDQITKIVQAKTLHDMRWLNIEDINYQECVLSIRKSISTYLNENDVVDIYSMVEKCLNVLRHEKLMISSLDESLIEVLFYERKYINARNK